MGSYLKLHLDLSPLYVLLLLLTLSHGRPSTRIREPFSPKNYITAFSPFPSANSQLSNSSAPDLRRKNFGTYGLRKTYAKQGKHMARDSSTPFHEGINENSAKVNEATSSVGGSSDSDWDHWAIHTNLLLHPFGGGTTNDLNDGTNILTPHLLHHPVELLKEVDGGGLLRSSEKKIKKKTKKKFWPIGATRDAEEEEEVAEEEEEEEAPLLPGRMDLEETYSSSSDEYGGEESEDEEQLEKFRRNILKELGFDESDEEEDEEDLKRVTRSTTSRYPSTNIPSSNITPKLNISREEYLEAYSLYMYNVRKRKEKARINVNSKNRRKNAVTFAQTYYDNGTDHPVSEGGVLTTFSFSIDSETPSSRKGVIRLRKAFLNLPASCNLSSDGDIRKHKIKRTSGLKGRPEANNDTMVYDVTDEVNSWIFHADSSPFVVMASCSQREVEEEEEEERLGGRMSTLKMVWNELSVEKSRAKRSAHKSTLQNFKNTNTGGGGRDCSKTRRGKACCRRSLKVKFADLGISDVIIEPQEFDAHVCVGRCNAKRVAYSTTHAMFQHILHQTKGKKFAPRPCCTPTKLTELDVIHLDSSGKKLQVTVLKDAIVEECGCS